MKSGADADWGTLERLFHAGIAMPAEARLEWLARECAENARLRSRLTQMWLAADRVDGPLERPPPALNPLDADEDSAIERPRHIGQYRITRVIGQGASSTVYEATQESTHRRVALKILHAGLTSERMRRRFEYEAELLGRLEHPGIAQVLDAGSFPSDEGPRPFIAMEFVDGVPLGEFTRLNPLSIRAKLELMAAICDALDHAHQRAVIHRDLKPANILVCDEAPSGRSGATPKIVDFGIARDVEPRAAELSHHTGIGQFLGTLPYMSPEQLSGSTADIDRRTDVYALGVVLYEMLAERLPHELPFADLLASIRILRERDPTPLSELRREFRGDLSIIVGKALEKDAQRRYGSAGELAADIRRHLHDEPIAARAASTAYQLWKFSRRNRMLVAGAGATAGALLLGVIGTGWMAIAEMHARDTAEKHRQRAERTRDSARAQLATALGQVSSTLEFTEQELADLPGASRARLMLAESGVRNFTQLVDQAGADGLVGGDLAQALGYAHQRLGEAHLALGHDDQALESFTAALRARRDQLHANPHDPNAIRTTGVGLWKTGDVLLQLHAPQAAARDYLDALQLMQRLYSYTTGTPAESAGVYLGLGHRRLADAWLEQGALSAAMGEYQQAVIQFERGITPIAGDRQHLRGRARALIGLAHALLRSKRASEACERATDARECAKRLAIAGEAPGLTQLTLEAQALAVRADACAALGMSQASAQDRASALEIINGLALRDPASAEVRVLAEKIQSPAALP